MDTPALSTPSGAVGETPLRIGAVALAVHDLDRMVAFYGDVIGLDVQAREQARVELGAGGESLLVLEHRPDARPDDRRTAGLFHTAFLMPHRSDLGRFVRHLAAGRTPVSGAADHLVSEAIYLDDPEGNGVEIYADRPAAGWQRDGTAIAITTDPLDIQNLMASSGDAPPFHRAPAGLRIGHVHLRVGDTARAEQFYGGLLGLDVTARMRGAVFLSSGGYHHHIAANTWSSAGVGRRDDDRTGLAWLRLDATGAYLADVAARLADAGLDATNLHDPWHIPVRLTPR
jgi:catechol 2,3-dioxygenase